MVPVLECVPNVSEGRRPEVVARLGRAVAVAGVRLLDLSSDPDHNRSVLTLAGEPEALHRGLLALYETALAEIDLARHQGVHPRVGAIDVVPFVPLAETEMPAAVAAARRLARAVAEKFDIPVYLYERAAAEDGAHRRTLPQIRRGGFAGLGTRIADPAWAPDFGPRRLHPTAGATVIGARFFLIAFNALLSTPDVSLARDVARAVRESSGGLPAVRAMGVFLASRGRAQVSMNLIDFRRTPLAAALALVRDEARRRGVEVLETELVGLLPEQAALDAARDALALPALTSARLLEHRLREES